MNTALAEPDAAVFMGSGFSRNDERSWDRTLARFHTAQTTLDTAVHEPDQDLYDGPPRLPHRRPQSPPRPPRPRSPALAAKLDIIVAHLVWETSGSEDCLETLRQDAHRLAAAPC